MITNPRIVPNREISMPKKKVGKKKQKLKIHFRTAPEDYFDTEVLERAIKAGQKHPKAKLWLSEDGDVILFDGLLSDLKAHLYGDDGDDSEYG